MYAPRFLLLAMAVVVVTSSLAISVGRSTSATSGPATSFTALALPAASSLGSSTSYAGYVVGSTASGVSMVKGDWKVPKFVGTCGSKGKSIAYFGVGIDGGTSRTTEAAFTYMLCLAGTLSYVAGADLTPNFYTAGSSISPGDHMRGTISYSSVNGFTVNIQDLTAKWSSKTTQFVSGAARSSALWFTAVGVISGTPAKLADFSKLTFTNATATVNGTSKSISGFTNVAVVLFNTAGTTVMAVSSSLTTTGKGFTVTWKSAGP